MKKVILCLSVLVFSISSYAQDIQLPQPVKNGGKPLMEALNGRQSDRSFSEKELDNQTLSNLLWAAYGFNREDKRTVPSSQNKQEIDLYVMKKDGIYFYDAKSSVLKLTVKGDFKAGLGRQEFAKDASINIICVANTDKASNREACFFDSGLIMQNIGLFCASEGLGNVIRGSFDRKLLPEYLKLTENQIVTMTQVVGYTK